MIQQRTILEVVPQNLPKCFPPKHYNHEDHKVIPFKHEAVLWLFSTELVKWLHVNTELCLRRQICDGILIKS